MSTHCCLTLLVYRILVVVKLLKKFTVNELPLLCKNKKTDMKKLLQWENKTFELHKKEAEIVFKLLNTHGPIL
jgi:hypothetical protein